MLQGTGFPPRYRSKEKIFAENQVSGHLASIPLGNTFSITFSYEQISENLEFAKLTN